LTCFSTDDDDLNGHPGRLCLDGFQQPLVGKDGRVDRVPNSRK
jgi:hypothetical protein